MSANPFAGLFGPGGPAAGGMTPEEVRQQVLGMAGEILAKQQDTADKKAQVNNIEEMLANVVGLHAGSDSPIMRHVDPANKISVPEGMELDRAALTIQQEKEAAEKKTRFPKRFDFSYYDGLVALNRVLRTVYGAGGQGVTRFSFFGGEEPPAMIPVVVDMKLNSEGKAVPVEESVPGSEFVFAALEATFEPGVWNDPSDGLDKFYLIVTTKARKKNAILGVFELIQQAVDSASIYRGQILRFDRTKGDLIHQYREDDPRIVYNDDTKVALTNAIWGNITHAKQLKAAGHATDFRVVLYGPLGTGKSAGMISTAILAKEYGLTVIEYSPNAGATVEEMEKVFALAKLYGPSVLLIEDIDRFFPLDPQSLSRLTNLFDGPDKRREVSVVMTTNYLEKVDPAMTRAPRITDVVEIGYLDATSVERLLHITLDGKLGEVDFSKVWAEVKDYAPSFLTNAFGKSDRIRIIQNKGDVLDTDALVQAAKSYKAQHEIHSKIAALKAETKPNHLKLAVRDFLETLFGENDESKFLNKLSDKVAGTVASRFGR